MIKLLLQYFFVFILPFISFSQDCLFEIEQTHNEREQVISIIDEENGNILICLNRKDEIVGHHFDGDFKKLWYFNSEKPEKFGKYYLGATTTVENIVIYFSNKNFSGISSVNLNLKMNTITKKIIDYQIKNERYLSSQIVNNKLYILSIVNSSSKLRLYEFNSGDQLNDYTFDFSEYKFTNGSNELRLSDLLELGNLPIRKFLDAIPTSIELINALNKIYFQQDKIFLSLDCYKDFTKLIIIDLESYKSSIEDYHYYPRSYNKKKSGKSNSFISQDMIFQLRSSPDEIAITVKDLKSKESLKEIFVKKEDSLFFQNNPAVYEYTSFPWDMEIEEFQFTQDILRKVSQYNAGIAVLRLENMLEVTNGGLKIRGVSRVVTQTDGFKDKDINSKDYSTRINQYSPFYPQVTYNFHNYTQSKSFKLKIGLYDNSYQYMQKKIDDNIFERSQKKLEETVNNFLVKLIFILQDKYYLIYFNKQNKKYYLTDVGRLSN